MGHLPGKFDLPDFDVRRESGRRDEPKGGRNLKVELYGSTKAVLRIRIRLDPFHFDQPDPELAKIMENFNENHRISYIFFITIKLMFTDINIYPIDNKTDHISEKYIFL